MATTTPNYGWPVPTSTDLVKDGATAIEALGDAVDATVFGLGFSGAWTSWTPTISGTGWSVGNGTLQAFYKQIGKTVVFRIRFVLGSTTGKGTQTLGWSLPVNAITGQLYAPFANSIFLDAGSQLIPGFAYSQGPTNIDVFVMNVSSTYPTFNNVTATQPFTWATNDEVLINGTYEAA
jgi:hypothetical protein